jgi:hypothetical protein
MPTPRLPEAVEAQRKADAEVARAQKIAALRENVTHLEREIGTNAVVIGALQKCRVIDTRLIAEYERSQKVRQIELSRLRSSPLVSSDRRAA